MTWFGKPQDDQKDKPAEEAKEFLNAVLPVVISTQDAMFLKDIGIQAYPGELIWK